MKRETIIRDDAGDLITTIETQRSLLTRTWIHLKMLPKNGDGSTTTTMTRDEIAQLIVDLYAVARDTHGPTFDHTLRAVASQSASAP